MAICVRMLSDEEWGRGGWGLMEKIDDLLDRLRDKATAARGQGGQTRILPDRHPVRDFFIADLVDWALKDDWHSMEHPFFSLSKNPDREIRRYDHNGISITVTPSVLGLATIWDKDILIYAVSQLVEAFNQGRRDVGPRVRITAYDLLVATNRYSGGKNYEQLAEACRRLAGTRIETDIKTNGVRQREGFGLLDGWKIIERHPNNGRMVAIELRLSDWLYNAVLACEVLTLNRDYFRISGGLDRRLYELARKHCGNQAKWTISTKLLHKKSGSRATIVKFREMLKRTAMDNCLPDYRVTYDTETDQAMFLIRGHNEAGAALSI
jgi:plasmid replication initiation protein